MFKKNRLNLIIASIITLLPILAGVVLWEKLPDNMATHFSASGSADGFASKAFAVFGLPLILLGIFWICIFFTMKDVNNQNQNKKALGIIYWIIPILSCVVNGIVYLTALGKEMNPALIVSLLLGFMFIIIGNYLPKCKQNFTLGIKIKWTLENEENWNKTHRFAGKVWFIGGFIMLLTAFLTIEYALLSIIILIVPMVALPVIYSYSYHKKQLKEGTATVNPIYDRAKYKKIGIGSTIVLTIIIIGIIVIMFTGNIKPQFNEESLIVDSTYWQTLEVDYKDIEDIEFKEDFSVGMKTNGFNSARLSLGEFKNKELGDYTVLVYNAENSVVAIKTKDRVLVINADTKEATKEIYEELYNRIKH